MTVGSTSAVLTADTRLFRAGAAAGIVGSVMGVAVNAGHPRVSSGELNDTQALLVRVAAADAWRPLHLGAIVAIVISLAALAAILGSMMLVRSGPWPTIALASVAVTAPVLLVSTALDGFAVKSIADQWAAATGPERDALLASAETLRSVDIAVLNLTLIGSFGVTALLTGVATWTTPSYGPLLAVPALLGGVTGLGSGMLQGLSGRLTTFSYLVLLTISLLLFTVWLLVASARLWSQSQPARR